MRIQLRIFFIMAVALALLLNTASAHEKNISVTIKEDGTSIEKIIWKIKVDKFFSYIPVSYWGIQIPKKSKIISVKDAKGNLPHEILEFQNTEYNLLRFENRERIFVNSKYFFEIEYEVQKNLFVFEPYYFYKRSFTRFENDGIFSLVFVLPENSEIISNSQPQIPMQHESSKVLSYQLNRGETKNFEISFLIPDKKPVLVEVSSKFYTINVPKKYEKDYSLLLAKADRAIESMEKIYGFFSPFQWNIQIITPDAEDFNETAEGFYLGDGKIRIKATQLMEDEKEILYEIAHETAHGFNSIDFNDIVPNFWWKEGSAVYVAFKSLEKQEYNFDETKRQMIDLAKVCMKYDKSLITGWSPNVYLSPDSDVIVNCEDKQTSKKNVGYAFSFLIISSLAEKYNEQLFQKFHNTANQLKINFSSDRAILNNQMNYVMSKAVGSDTTELLNSFNLNVEKINDDQKTKIKTMLTGMPIYEEEEINKTKIYAFLLVLIIFLIVFLVIKIRKQKSKKVFHAR